jgi:hypothetical protein
MSQADQSNAVEQIDVVSIEPAEGGGARIVARSGKVYELKVPGALVARSLIQILQGIGEGAKKATASTVHEPEWNCERCTFLNAPNRTACEICDGPKPEVKCVQAENTLSSEQAHMPSTPLIKLTVANCATEEDILAATKPGDQEVISASALSADGAIYELGEFGSTVTILALKQTLATKSSMAVESQQLFLIDDKRQDVENLELRNSETMCDARRYCSGAGAGGAGSAGSAGGPGSGGMVQLHFAVMVGLKNDNLVRAYTH